MSIEEKRATVKTVANKNCINVGMVGFEVYYITKKKNQKILIFWNFPFKIGLTFIIYKHYRFVNRFLVLSNLI